MRERPLRIGVLVSGSGTNLQAIMDACADGRIDGEVIVVVSDKADAYALTRAKKAGTPGVIVDRAAHDDAAAHNGRIRDVLLEHGVELVVMAGYMRLLGTEVLDAFPQRVLNIHPALLPSFPGAHGIEDAYAYGVKVTGVTVHFASEVFDDGPIIAQEAVTVEEDDTIEELEERMHAVEHRIYPRAIQLYAEGRLHIDGRITHILSETG